jgi:hypothetical protein
MTVDGVVEVIAFIVGGLVLAWGFRSLAFASSGGERSGMSEIVLTARPTPDGEEEPDAEEVAATAAASRRRQFRFHQIANYVLSLAALAALTAMLIGAWVA